MTKGALNVLGRSLANTLGERGITVNTVSPGVTDTDMNSWLHDSDDASDGWTDITALDRIGKADEIADAAVFFATNDSRWVTGQNLDVNGGLYLGPRTHLLPS
jgi:NAD(P)-dependent dehydrogenase (short-subunit alcohol dehydrogenase family)